MVQTLDRGHLKKLLMEQKTKKHDTGKVLDILPFLTKRTRAIRGQFNNVLGEYVRNISEIDEKVLKNKKSNDFYMVSEENIISELIANEVEFNSDDDKFDFVRFLNQYLFNQDDIQPVHPFIFNYIKLDKAQKNEFGKYARFMSEVLVKGHPEIKSIFTNKDSEDILTELILNKLDTLQENKDEKQDKLKKDHYQPLLPSIAKLYQEDMVYLSRYKDYFLTSFPILTHFYTFMYACQLIFKFEQFTEADFNSTQPLYFALEWESISKRRKVADELDGFKYIKGKSNNLFPHIHTISQLSYNSFTESFDEENERLSFIPYSEIYNLITSQGEEYEKDFLMELNQWINDYSKWAEIEIPGSSDSIPNAFKVLFTCLKEGTSSEVAKKYGENIEDLGAPFLKSRGNLGQVYNIKHDFLLLLTAVSVKDKRMPLNELFAEFEKRGVAFDRYSKKEIITLFDNHNILDKKSDSGDAQYVKPILL
ncbi:DNA phosphorothioation-dependent restriction protein DptG [Peribacillus frigoritolerans]|uniref:DNA phosphorothioation-dependent restriction protein DptG n=1 Tax=Peribacillus frigoritolerans TaxID=450367 RepID=UPI000FD8AEAB|nr:DNA phosphorothioation-dependent restriction protein DptG [Peribacillus frigoritolerans]AZV62921.1 DNA phosphorothioation-dependent restriction protein DptG [Peribacillus frigoritolerans]